jgi:inhibitor of KinA
LRIEPVGDQAFSLRLGEEKEPDRVLAALACLDSDRPAGVTDVVPGYASLLVIYDAGRADPGEVRAWVAAAAAAMDTGPGAAPARRRVEIPVLYDPAVAPDLEALAREKDLSIDALVALHTAPTYRCHLLGFRPGFPYLGGLDPRLVTARLDTPRVRIPAGSVGIGGAQTGVYPVDSPGGWRIIGRTPLRLFDPARADPFLVQAGDAVAFVAIDKASFAAGRFAAPGGARP